MLRANYARHFCLDRRDLSAFVAYVRKNVPQIKGTTEFTIAELKKILGNTAKLAKLWEKLESHFDVSGDVTIDGEKVAFRRPYNRTKTRPFCVIDQKSLPWLRAKLGLDTVKPDKDWLIIGEVAKEMRINPSPNAPFGKLWNELAATPADLRPVMLEGQPLTCGYIKRKGVRFAVHRSALPSLAAALQHIPRQDDPRPENLITLGELRARLNLIPNSEAIKSIETRARVAIIANAPIMFANGCARAFEMKINSKQIIYFEIAAIDLFAAEIGKLPRLLPDVVDEEIWLSQKILQSVLHERSARFRVAWKRMKVLVDAGKPVVLDGVAYRMERRKNLTTTGYYLNKDSLEAFRQLLKTDETLAPLPATTDWIARRQAARAAGTTEVVKSFKAIWNQLVQLADAKEPTVIDGLAVPFENRLGGSRYTYHLHREAIGVLKVAIARRKRR